MTPLRRLQRYLAPYKTKFIVAALCILAVNLFRAAGPIVLQRVVDSLTYKTTSFRLLQYGGLVMLIALAQAVFRFSLRRSFIGMSCDVEYDLRKDLYAHLQKLPLEFFQANRTGDLMSRATSDVEAVRVVIAYVLMFSINLLLSVLLIMPIMVYLSWRLTLLSLLSVPLAVVATKFFSRRIHDRFTTAQENFGMVANRAQESLSGVRTVKAYNQEQSEVEGFRKINRRYLEQRLRLARLSAFFDPAQQFFIGLGSVAVLWYGGELTIEGTLSVGQFVAFMLYLEYLVWPMSTLGGVISVFQRGMASMGRIRSILSVEPAIKDSRRPIRITKIAGEIEFRDLTFRYNGATSPALCGINLRIPAGRTIAVLGAVGSGKSTMMNLIPRLLDADPGQVLIDGHPIQEIPLELLRSSIGYVPQEAFLFSDTIAGNIAFGAQGACRQDIELAAAEAAIADEIADFPNGYDTLVGERGIMLSGGQKQRITIARAMIRRPGILLLDGALSSVDAYTEEKVLKHLRKLMQGRTCLISGQRVSAVKDCDLIVILHEGRIVERGTHDELLAYGGLYAELYEKQLLEEELSAN